jgi:hypothetical protein
MKAIRCREWGTPDVLRLEEAESPSLKPHQVRIRVRAAGVNFADSLICSDRPAARRNRSGNRRAAFIGRISAPPGRRYAIARRPLSRAERSLHGLRDHNPERWVA